MNLLAVWTSHGTCGRARFIFRCGGRYGQGIEPLRGRVPLGFEHGHHRSVGHILVGPRHVEFVGTQPRARRWRIGLDGVAFVHQALVVDALEEPPDGLHVLIFVGDVGVFEVYPVAHLAGYVVPDVFVAHDGFAAGAVVRIYGDLDADVFLGDAQFRLYFQLDGQAVGVPAAFAFYALTLKGLVAAENVFDGAGHDVVNARQAVGRRRAFVKHEGVIGVPLLDAAGEDVLPFPEGQDFLIDGGEVQLFMLCVDHGVKVA